MGDISPLEPSEKLLELHQLVQLPAVKLTVEQKAVDAVAIEILKEFEQIEESEITHQVVTIEPTQAQEIDQIAIDQEILPKRTGSHETPTIEGDRYTLPPKTVEKLLLVFSMALDSVGGQKRREKKKEAVREDIKTPDCALISSDSFFRRFRYELTLRSAAL